MKNMKSLPKMRYQNQVLTSSQGKGKIKKKRKKINIPVHKPLASEFDFFG
jgi:hypothetical protein